MLVLACLALACAGCGAVPWRVGLDQTMKKAAREDRLVLVYYSQAFNEDCAKMDRTVFRSKEVLAEMKGMLPVKLDATLERKRVEQFGLRQAPGFLVLSPQGEVLRGGYGPMDVDQFLAFLVMGKLNR